MAQFGIALDWLMENAKEDDKVIIYFSGHGDVEKRTLTQPGFLLCWDAPARVYISGGAFALPMLQEVISTISIQNKAKVIVITDACHSGTLAGSSVGGSQATASNLARQYANEIKIMSCQPNEYSIEGEQWGEGRGAFSFHLVDALYGLADSDEDQWVTLYEVGRYLEDHVAKEVAPINQLPMVLGNRNERVTSVDDALLASIRSGKRNQMMMFTPIESKGMEEQVLTKLDTTIKSLYQLFKKSLRDKVFLKPENACANFYYEKLIAEPKLARLQSTMRRNYAAALQDDAQQVMNVLLKTGLTQEVLSGAKAYDLYKDYPSYLQRAGELLGSSHYLYNTLQARKYYFEGRMQPTIQESKKKYLQALQWQANLPHAFVALINTYQSDQIDSAIYYATNAMELVPTWILPYVELSRFYELNLKQYDKAEELLNTATQIDSNSVLVWHSKAVFYKHQKEFKKSMYWFKKVEASTNEGICFPCALMSFGDLYVLIGQLPEAENCYLRVIQLDPNIPVAYYNLACILSLQNKTDEAFPQLELAFKKGFPNREFNNETYESIQNDEDLEHLREQKDRWNALMKKYFNK